MSNTNRAISRVRRTLGKKRMYESMAIAKRKVTVHGAIEKTTPRGTDYVALAQYPGMVTIPDGTVKFRPVRPVPVRRGKV